MFYENTLKKECMNPINKCFLLKYRYEEGSHHFIQISCFFNKLGAKLKIELMIVENFLFEFLVTTQGNTI